MVPRCLSACALKLLAHSARDVDEVLLASIFTRPEPRLSTVFSAAAQIRGTAFWNHGHYPGGPYEQRAKLLYFGHRSVRLTLVGLH